MLQTSRKLKIFQGKKYAELTIAQSDENELEVNE